MAAAAAPYALTPWEVSFLDPLREHRNALIILNQPFSFPLLDRVWHASRWHACADGGANRLHDLLISQDGKDKRHLYTPDLIKGDLDSIRDDVRAYYASQGVRIVRDEDQDSTDLMKCIGALVEDEKTERHVEVPKCQYHRSHSTAHATQQNTIVLLGGLSGRLDQTVHTLSLVHKLRKSRRRTFVITDDNVAWLLDTGEHRIHVDHELFGPTCGLLPVGIDSTILTTTGLRWNLRPAASLEGLPLSALADVLAARHPGTRLGEVLAQSQWAVDEEMVEDPARVVLKGGEEVAVICPVSGG
ncbi:Thiamin pyrophosphokinase 1 [Trametes pubescens]|uniref:Thiamin pyrophosphokinase 1 n=1 Tax=Trametes pubescens TaxID=154538 RepID=A0A1M2W639_TRAPU|nr:Thiamin pyrophosphokinase 1 [Trametes pubescens]